MALTIEVNLSPLPQCRWWCCWLLNDTNRNVWIINTSKWKFIQCVSDGNVGKSLLSLCPTLFISLTPYQSFFSFSTLCLYFHRPWLSIYLIFYVEWRKVNPFLPRRFDFAFFLFVRLFFTDAHTFKSLNGIFLLESLKQLNLQFHFFSLFVTVFSALFSFFALRFKD